MKATLHRARDRDRGRDPQPGRLPAAPRLVSLDEWLLRHVLRLAGEPAIEIRLGSGARASVPGVTPVATMRIADRATLLRILRNPQMEVGDAYSNGGVDIEGDLVMFMKEVYRAAERAGPADTLAQRLGAWRDRSTVRSLASSRQNAQYHYDLGNEFYSLWLGDTMAYTCAYYPTLDATLDHAQAAKMDHVCRKLRLQRGDTVIEAGCGWGALALHMASHYGARVRAFNVSTRQLAFARERCKALGLESQVEFIEDDYRNISGRYDAFVSIGMLEHVGPEHYAELGRVACESLGDNGRGLIHSIGRNQAEPTHPWIERRIFPGSYIPSIGQMMAIFEPWRLSVLDVENLRPHYALTLRDWLRRYEDSVDAVRAMFDERFVRMWRLYLNGSIAAFECGELQLFQVLFAMPRNNQMPLTREDLYRPQGSRACTA
jgi:cyclopropane-fatty-acyl-phospholipid synthase